MILILIQEPCMDPDCDSDCHQNLIGCSLVATPTPPEISSKIQKIAGF